MAEYAFINGYRLSLPVNITLPKRQGNDKGNKVQSISNVPGEYECGDGELAVAVNILSEGGELKPFVHPEPFMSIDGRLIAVHRGNNYENFITLTSNGQVYFQTRTSTPFRVATGYDPQCKVECLGNTLILLHPERPLRYLLWKGTEYKDLGHKPPFPSISFGLRGNIVKSENFSISIQNIGTNSVYSEFSSTNKERVSAAVIPYANAFIQQQSRDKGKFIFPFFVRYAYRLYDDSLFMHSAPILMLPSSGIAPSGVVTRWTGSGSNYNTMYVTIQNFVTSLDYGVANYENIINELGQWSDIVKSIDIFISAPIYTYDQEGQCWGVDNINSTGYPYYGILNYNDETFYGTRLYRQINFYNVEPTSVAMLRMPERKRETVREEIANTSLFYKISSIDISDLSSARKEVELKESVLNTLQLQEVMTDDYNSHDRISAGMGYTYNARLNVANITRELFEGFPAESTNGRINSVGTIETSYFNYVFYVFIKEDNREYVVRSYSNENQYEPFCHYLFYPNVNPYRMVIAQSQYMTSYYADIELTPHPSLNGAYWFGGFEELKFSTTRPDGLTVSTDISITVQNKIYNSETNNPFVFPVSGIVTVGTSDIRAMASATKALSQGQFGQFSLYVFTGEGVWALEVSELGTYSSRQMVARDVLSNPNGILQIDGAIAFTTDRGLMLLQGSEVVCISAKLTGPTFDKSFVGDVLGTIPEWEKIDRAITQVSFKSYLSGAFLAYDYANGRIFVINPDQEYAYVFLIDGCTWGTISSPYIRATNNYPDSYLTDREGGMSNISAVVSEDDSKQVEGFVLTRSLKLDAPDILKTVRNVIHRGDIPEPGKIATVLFGSRDNKSFVPLASAYGNAIRRVHGTPYKYFRLFIKVQMVRRESIAVTTFEYDMRYTNKLR